MSIIRCLCERSIDTDLTASYEICDRCADRLSEPRLSSFEHSILETVFDLVELQHGYNIGAPVTKEMLNKPYNRLMDLCSDYASGNDGRLSVKD